MRRLMLSCTESPNNVIAEGSIGDGNTLNEKMKGELELQQMLLVLDTDKDGKIKLEDFIRLLLASDSNSVRRQSDSEYGSNDSRISQSRKPNRKCQIL